MADGTAFATLSLRFFIVTGIFALVYGMMSRKSWLSVSQVGHAAISGILLHGFYLGGVFWSLQHGMPATVSALIASLQPVFIAILAVPLLGEHITPFRWGGIAMGFLGTILVIGFDVGTEIPVITLIICFCALGASIAGTLYQKRFGQNLPLIPANIMQALAATALHLLLLGLFEVPHITFTSAYIIGMTWQILAVSLGAYVMLLVLLRRGSANQTSSLLFLIAPVAAVQSWLLLGEAITALDLIGLVIASAGVFIATRTDAS